MKIILIFLGILFIVLYAMSCRGERELIDFTDGFLDNMNNEVDAINEMTSMVNKSDSQSDSGIAYLQAILPIHVQRFSQILASYREENPPDSAPESLKEAVEHAIEGTEQIITGLSVYEKGLEEESTNLISSGIESYNTGISLLNQARSEYLIFADDYNSRTSSWSSPFLGIIVGTAALWGLIFLIINPITNYLAKRKAALQFVTSGVLPANEEELSKKTNQLFNTTYMFVSVLVLGIAGFLFGFLLGGYFIGIAWKVRYWPGMIALIGLSFLGSYLY